MTTDEIMFFQAMPNMLPIYEGLVERMLCLLPDTVVRVQKTQITFQARHGFAFVSLRRMRGCPKEFFILSFGLEDRLDSPRIAMAVEPYPHRWTHHLIITEEIDLDEEVMGWLKAAHDFALRK